MNVLVVDVGGTHVKVLAIGQKAHRQFDSGPTLTPKQMVAGVKKLVADWNYEAISIGYPGPVLRNRPRFRSHGTLTKGGPVSISKRLSNVRSRS